MTQGERVRKIRKSLGLTLEKFGKKLGIGKTAISKIEHEQCSLTDANIKLICREFSVDYIWLTTGEGEMFVDSDDDFIEKINRIMIGENDARKSMIKTLVNASDDDIQVLCRLIDSYNSLSGNDE
ncbi:MAG: helix-turn-helix transcriptional regulator [Lachnospiraceae bacterium]|jgi:transcriptional regulator with XRE-family HTH domain|nr:helix-turn-helix transcriptional regulator [Lachnospiraceae bacterium]MCI9203837.1 helix-turn-helix transcriptional regulator [Lachnospiraceae bacterium]MCI9570745.1 helix-turn-helix transcriptional regulator [Lachnospiraceae bacterium]